jgi:hypothetical protein
VYLDVGASSGDTAMLAFAFNGIFTTRTWEIKVTQLPCSSASA